MKIIESSNIFNDKVNQYLEREFHSNSEYLYLSATNNVFNERKRSVKLSSYFNNKNKMFVSEGFESYLTSKIRSAKDYLPLIDMYYILKKVIDDYFKCDNPLRISYQNIYYKLFELYKFLMFHFNSTVSNELLNSIETQYTEEYFYIFDIYNKYINTITEIINYINDSISEKVHYKNEELGIDILVEKGDVSHFDTFIQKQKGEIYKYISKVNTLYFDGFIAFNDLDKFIIYNAIKLGKKVVFITKEISSEEDKDFLIDNVYGYNLDKEKIEIINLSDDPKGRNERTSISYIRKNFYNPKPTKEDKALIDDGHINFIAPFLNKSDELEYIPKKIGELIKRENIDVTDIENLRKFIENNILVVCAVDKEITANYLDNQLEKTGIFVFKSVPNNLMRKEVDLKTFENIYFDIREFLDEDIQYCDGTKLTLSDKKLLFNSSFFRLQIPTKLNIFDSAPVLEFIFQIYDLSKNKIDIEKFKALLFSNWYYNIGKSKTKWDTLLGAFEQIKAYFENKDTLDQWINEIKQIIKLKKQIDKDELYKFHPFNSVSEDELTSISQVMETINCLAKSLANVYGDFNKHVAFLKENIISNGTILFDDNQALTESQKIIKEFCEVLDNLVFDSTIQNYDSEFFAQHLKNIIKAFQTNTRSNENNINLNFQNMLNLKHYKYVFFIGFEADKYPRKHDRKFPFTQEIIEIIRMIGIKSYDVDIYDHNIKMEQFFFKNVLDFVDHTIYFSCTKQQNQNMSSFSLYAEDIATAFDSDLKFEPFITYIKNKQEKVYAFSPLYVNPKDEYTLKELVTFQLCPKLYYHLYVNASRVAFINKNQLRLYAEAVIYSDLLGRFMDYNYENKKWYFSGNKEVYSILNDLSDKTFHAAVQYFDCLQIPELKMIKSRSLARIIRIIEDYIINGLKYNQYTIVRSKGKVFPCNGFNLLLEYDTAIFSNKEKSRRIDQNKIYLDFLTLKCTSRDVPEKHYKDMVNLLHKKNKYIDRVFFANRMLSKINVQFDSGVESFIFKNDGGLERVNNLRRDILEEDFLKVEPYTSNFCDYCILRNICMGGKETQERIEVKE